MVTIKDVANQAGTSVGSVSRYLNGYKLKKANEQRIEEAIQKLEYIPNRMAKSLKTQKSFSIGVLVDTMSNFYSAQLVATLEQIFDENGYFLLLTSHQNNEQVFEKKLNNLLERSIDSLIVVKAKPSWETFQNLEKIMIPFVSVGVPTKTEKIPSVLTNDKASVKAVVKKMLETSKKVGFIVPSEKDYVLNQRIEGIQAAFIEKNFFLSSEQFIYADYGTENAYEKAKWLVEKKFDGIFVTNYSNALLAVKAIQDSGKTVGEEVSVGCFGYTWLLKNMNIPVTMIKQPVDKIATLTGDIILSYLNEKKEYVQSKKIILQNEIMWQ